MLGFTKRFLQVNGVRVAHYLQGNGPPIVLLHGLPTSCFLWRDVIAPLRASYRLVAPDLLGLGDTSGPLESDHGLRAQALLVEGLLDRLGMEEVLLVGHDVGGAMAQWLALERPRRVRGLVLVDSVAYDNWPVPIIRHLRHLATWRPVWRLAVKLGHTTALGFAASGFRQGVKFAGSLTPVEIEEYLRPHQLSRSSREHLRQLLLSLDPEVTQDTGRRLGTLEKPSMVVWGADDAFLSPVWGRRLAADLRGAELHLLPECGHFVPEERPAELAALIGEFYAKILTRRLRASFARS